MTPLILPFSLPNSPSIPLNIHQLLHSLSFSLPPSLPHPSLRPPSSLTLTVSSLPLLSPQASAPDFLLDLVNIDFAHSKATGHGHGHGHEMEEQEEVRRGEGGGRSQEGMR